jgi:hypothetical protein
MPMMGFAGSTHPTVGPHESEASVVGWIVRGLLMVSSVVTGWFVSKDAPNFSFIQGMVSLVVVAVIVFVLAFWPARWSELLNRCKKPD